jgi:hypothetical protein
MQIRLMVCLAVMVGCGGSSSIPDAVKVSDASNIDAPPADAFQTGRRTYVASELRLPKTQQEASMFGLDLDGNGRVDNQLGQVLATLRGQGIDANAHTTEAVDNGAIITLFAVDTSVNPDATFAVFKGVSPVPTPCLAAQCRKHLQGDGAFTAALTPRDPAIAGVITNAAFATSAPGSIHVQFAIGGAPIVVSLIGARIAATGIGPSGISNVILAGAIPETELDSTVVPGLAQSFQATVTRDCPTATPPNCICADSDGKQLMNLFDTSPKDCAISVIEVKQNSVIQTLLAPDVTVNGTKGLSFGTSATAVLGTFTQ